MKKFFLCGLILASTPGLALAQISAGSGPATVIGPPAPAQAPAGTPRAGAFTASQATPPAEVMSPPSAPALAPGFPIGGTPTFGGGAAGPTPAPPRGR